MKKTFFILAALMALICALSPIWKATIVMPLVFCLVACGLWLHLFPAEQLGGHSALHLVWAYGRATYQGLRLKADVGIAFVPWPSLLYREERRLAKAAFDAAAPLPRSENVIVDLYQTARCIWWLCRGLLQGIHYRTQPSPNQAFSKTSIPVSAMLDEIHHQAIAQGFARGFGRTLASHSCEETGNDYLLSLVLAFKTT